MTEIAVSPKFAVNIVPPHAGWIEIEITFEDASFLDTFSHVWSDSMLRLVEIIAGLWQGWLDEMSVGFHTEPGFFELFFTSVDQNIILRIDEYPDAMFHVAHKRKVVFEAREDRKRMCLTFWRAFRKMQSQLTPEEFLKQWHYPFPLKQVELLTELIKA
jgi:hypothetical protein